MWLYIKTKLNDIRPTKHERISLVQTHNVTGSDQATLRLIVYKHLHMTAASQETLMPVMGTNDV